MKACGLLLFVVLAVAVACTAAAPDGFPPAVAPAVLVEVPATPESGVAGTESPDLDGALQIPMAERACKNTGCDYACLKRGYRYGRCTGATCYCYR